MSVSFYAAGPLRRVRAEYTPNYHNANALDVLVAMGFATTYESLWAGRTATTAEFLAALPNVNAPGLARHKAELAAWAQQVCAAGATTVWWG